MKFIVIDGLSMYLIAAAAASVSFLPLLCFSFGSSKRKEEKIVRFTCCDFVYLIESSV